MYLGTSFFVYAIVVHSLYSCFYFVSAPWAPSRVDMCALQIFIISIIIIIIIIIIINNIFDKTWI